VTDWAGFVGFAGVVLVLMLALAWLSRDAVSADPTASDRDEAVTEFNRVMGGPAPGPGEPQPGPEDSQIGTGDAGVDATRQSNAAAEPETTAQPDETTQVTVPPGGDSRAIESNPADSRDKDGGSQGEPTTAKDLSTGTLLVNVVITQGLFLSVLVLGLWWTEVSASAIGLAAPGTPVPALSLTSMGWGPAALGLGTALGTALYVFNQLGAALGDRVGIDSSTNLREALAPATTRGWAGLLGVVLPVVAIFEELLFRGVLIGGLAIAGVETGIAVSPWLLVGLSAVAFALGHGAQGRGGIVVTGALGGVLGAAFVLTWSLPLVIVAHYVVNALEFAIHEGLGIDWI
jgi:membrane protease YdiL (CAAX protease family)